MALFEKKRIQDLRNAPKGLSSEFQPDSSKKKATSFGSTANRDDPLGAERGKFVVSQLRCDNKLKESKNDLSLRYTLRFNII